MQWIPAGGSVPFNGDAIDAHGYALCDKVQHRKQAHPYTNVFLGQRLRNRIGHSNADKGLPDMTLPFIVCMQALAYILRKKIRELAP